MNKGIALPNSVMESIAYGTPAIAFRIGGMPNLIEHPKNGYLAEPFDIGIQARRYVSLFRFLHPDAR